MIHRDRIDKISQILEAANGGASKSKIMFKALLTSAQMKEILTALTETDLILYDENTRISRTTEKGLRFLQIYNQIGDMIKEEQSSQQKQTWIHIKSLTEYGIISRTFFGLLYLNYINQVCNPVNPVVPSITSSRQ